MYQLPPAGGYPSVFKFISKLLNPNNSSLSTSLEQSLEYSLEYSLGNKVYLTNSGKSALYAVLVAKANLAGKKANRKNAKKVLIPNYTCPDLVSAIVKAGLQTVLAPVEKQTLEVDKKYYEDLDSKDYLAVILPNLYGMLDSLPSKIDSEILVIDDLCQSLNSIESLRTEVAVFSSGRGKAICGFGGGGILVKDNEELEVEIKKITESFPSADSLFKDLKTLSYATLVPILENPYMFFLLNKIIKTGDVKVHLDFEIANISNLEDKYADFQCKLNKESLDKNTHLDWSKLIKSSSVIQPYLERQKKSKILNRTVFNRYPLILENVDNKLLEKLKRYGINASYQKALSQYHELKSFVIYDSKENQDFLQKLVTLPTHSKVKSAQVSEIVAILSSTKERN